jgi:hypothetical protein
MQKTEGIHETKISSQMLAFIPFHEALMQSQNRTIPMVLRR